MPLTRNFLDVRLMENRVRGRGKQIVLDREKTDERSGIILEKYKVGVDRSGDLKDY